VCVDSEAARNLQVFHRLTTAPRRNLSDEISPGLLPTNPTGDGLNLDPSETKSAEDKQALESTRTPSLPIPHHSSINCGRTFLSYV
jgi:hypothetical protein